VLKLKLTARRGSTMVEFAIASTAFFLLIFGAIEFSRGVWQYNIVANAAKAAARWAIVRGSSAGQTPATATDVHNYIVTQMYGYAETDTVNWLPTGTKKRGDTVQVIVRSSYQINVRGLPVYNLSLRSSAKMIIAR
jgi:Flp pilus assembly protein TadG